MKRGQFLIASLLALTLTLILFSINASDASAAEFTYIYLGNMLLERVDSLNNEVYFSQDSIGNNRIITDSSQNLIEKQDLELFGNKIAGTGSNFNSKLKFTGKERDSSGYDYFGARYYDSSLGRFISVDPIFNPTESSYSYAKNNPIKFVDPTGNQATAAALQQTATNVYEYLNYILPQTPPNIRPFI
ncbi:RHS repeat-associated core domain-containing protein, partial [Candidatus Woesearchaeota archaeon]|nr:RHS repeat-associated core domain-containing protein [Candidatus Woesearchaeota archaeon]